MAMVSVTTADTIRIECGGEGRPVTYDVADLLAYRDRFRKLKAQALSVLVRLEEIANLRRADEQRLSYARERLLAAVNEANAD